MAPFGPVPEIVGKDTSFNAPVSRRNVSNASTASISVSAPLGASRSTHARNFASAAPWCYALCAVLVPLTSTGFFDAFSSATGSVPRTGLPPSLVITCFMHRRRLRCRARWTPPVFASVVNFGKSVSGSRPGVLFEMIAGRFGQLAMIDEDGRATILGHQGVGQRQRRVRDVGAADVERPRHRMGSRTAPARRCRVWRSRARIRFELCRPRSRRRTPAVDRNRAQRRPPAFVPDRIERVTVDGNQFGARLGTGRRQPFGCRRSVHPGVKS